MTQVEVANTDLARSRADRIRLARILDPRGGIADIADAYRLRDWQTLGYRSPKEYFTVELGIASRTRSAHPDTRTVYFIQGVEGGPIKIGVAESPVRRLAEIQRMSPVPLRIIGLIPGVGQVGELGLHRRFAAHRWHGEWFEATPELCDYICRQAQRVVTGKNRTVSQRELIELWTWAQIEDGRAGAIRARRAQEDRIADYDRLLALRPDSPTPEDAARRLGTTVKDFLAISP